MRKIILLLFLSPLFFNSCQYFDKQIPTKEELLQKELKTINWEEVDEFPSFSRCDSVQNKEQKKTCFFEYLTQLIQERLSFDTISVIYPQLDTIDVKVTVLANATLQFEPQLNDSLSYDKPIIDSILRARLVGFPKVIPAIKRGIPVKTEFILPVILKVE
ncbi:hypothetical protein [Flavobacterium luteum]|uniref:TonB C-terminal domain-containing protein n=1 Tax=Flavobacterium luteum TaxID=2026654 RepID=A0A7J5AH35_9FLAO|nr:hypothetical protein [Flavobacterium luteum]KAB1156803.1 hypothetical protein F6464_05480 [Flavobacterium luteum]